MLQIIPVHPRAVEVALNMEIDLPAVAFVGIDEDEIIGTGGLAWGKGRCWLWFALAKPDRKYATAIIRKCRQVLKKARQLGETEVYTIRDPEFDTSERLCRFCGFEPAGIEDGQEIYKCAV